MMQALIAVLFFPSGLALLAVGLAYSWANRKLLARYQSRLGPPWYQPFADTVKLLNKEDMPLEGTNPLLFHLLPMLALAGGLTAALYLPMFGLGSAFSFAGDFIVVLYLLSLSSFALGLIGLLVTSRVSAIGSSRVMTQLFAYEAPYLLALLCAAFNLRTWQLSELNQAQQWGVLTQPLGFLVLLMSMMGKLELPPFDAPEAETEIVGGALTEYTGRSLALFKMAKAISFVLSLILAAMLYLGGLNNPLDFLLKTLILLVAITSFEALFTRLRIDQSLKLWWRYALFAALLQWLWVLAWEVLR
jgi:NADH-quinone oxidoreductase subunit H